MNRRLTLHLFGALTLATSPLAAVAQDTPAVEKLCQRGPYLATATPTSMTVVWRTSRPIDPQLHVGPGPGRKGGIVKGANIVARTVGTGPNPLSAAPPGA